MLVLTLIWFLVGWGLMVAHVRQMQRDMPFCVRSTPGIDMLGGMSVYLFWPLLPVLLLIGMAIPETPATIATTDQGEDQ